MFKLSKQQFRKMGFTHFVKIGNKRTVLLSLTECENCGKTIQAPNSLSGHEDDISEYIRCGIIELATLPAEGYYSDNINGEACENCNA